jgi:hypothetical protein
VIWGALVGGLLGTVVLTTLLRAAAELGLTRIDIPFLLGTALTEDRTRAKAAGYLMHFVFGALLGLLHGLFASTALVNVLLPALHPRMGSGFTAAGSAPLLEPPGFLLLNYGRQTPVVTLVAHLAYGAIVGGFAAWAG